MKSELPLQDVPWKRNSPTILLNSPKPPTITINFGLLTSKIIPDGDAHQQEQLNSVEAAETIYLERQ
jgi:hypothetical protein